MICTIRIPDVLQTRIDSAAGDGKRSEWILDACRMRLDATCEHGIAPSADAGCKTCHPWMFRGVAQMEEAAAPEAVTVAGSIPVPTIKAYLGSENEYLDRCAKPDMQALRDICAGKHGSDPILDAFIQIGANIEIPICGKQWWEDGEHYECLMDKGHREQKHGMRGMVRKID